MFLMQLSCSGEDEHIIQVRQVKFLSSRPLEGVINVTLEIGQSVRDPERLHHIFTCYVPYLVLNVVRFSDPRTIRILFKYRINVQFRKKKTFIPASWWF